MAKFKVNDPVIVVATGMEGVIIAREEKRNLSEKFTEIKYLVKLGDGFENYHTFDRSELARKPYTENDDNSEKIRIIDAPNGVKITIVTKVEKQLYDTIYNFESDVCKNIYGKSFKMGVAFYKPTDEYPYDEMAGIKIARHRIKTSPFCSLEARFRGEFNEPTVEALIDVKAKYLLENIDKFIN